MRAKEKSGEQPVRYVPIDEELYPEVGEDGEVRFYRFWCRPLWVVYEKYRNGVKLGYLILPQGKEIFLFDRMVAYAEGIGTGGAAEVVCRKAED